MSPLPNESQLYIELKCVDDEFEFKWIETLNTIFQNIFAYSIQKWIFI